jgi:cellulose synthase/poly-beta-1,6-N-acetylglucosamine synthase-like glycosyltransferase
MRATVFGSSLLHLLTGGRFPRRHPESAKAALPGISVIVRVGSDDPCLPALLASLDSLDYPDDKLDIVFIAEGPDGHSGSILRMTANPMRQVVVLRSAGRMNRAALNHAVSWAKHEILVFSDATAPLPAGALRELAGRLADGTVKSAGAGMCALRREWFLPLPQPIWSAAA